MGLIFYHSLSLYFLYSIFFLLDQSYAIDNIKMLRPLLGEGKRAKHKDEVIKRALEVSKVKYGNYTFSAINVDMTSSRALASIQSGRLINIFIAPASEKWEKDSIPIRVPIRLGLLSYRLLLVNKDQAYKFEHVESLKDLKEFTAGLQTDWITTDAFNASQMNSVIGHNFEGLFLMLKKKRFDFIPRAIYEIYDELDNRKKILSNITIEPTLGLYLPMATYVYVSQSAPKIAERIEYGLNILVKTGELKRILMRYYAEDIQRANFKNRKIIRIKNPYYHDREILNNKELWLEL